MTRTLLGLVVTATVLVAQVGRADDFDGHRPVAHEGCGPRPEFAPRGQNFGDGRYELRSVQQWVPASAQQVWVEGQCWGRGEGHEHGQGHWRRERFERQGRPVQCTPGHYQTSWTPGHYETTQQWVWVPVMHQQQQYGRRPGAGFRVNGPNGSFAVSIH